MSIRDFVTEITAAELRRHGIEPGRRHAGDDPQLTYQSDLAEEQVERILDDLDELTAVLTDHLPPAAAEFLANALIEWRRHQGKGNHRYQAAAASVRQLVEEYVKRWPE